MITSRAKIRKLDELVLVAEKLREKGKTLALTNGAFDLLHVGHVRYLVAAAELADVLIVAVNDDDSVRRQKGPARPIVPLDERVEMLAALACVDYLVSFTQDDVGAVICAIKPDVHVKGTDYRPDTIPERNLVLSYGGRVAVAGDAKNHSTSEIIQKLVGKKPSNG